MTIAPFERDLDNAMEVVEGNRVGDGDKADYFPTREKFDSEEIIRVGGKNFSGGSRHDVYKLRVRLFGRVACRRSVTFTSS